MDAKTDDKLLQAAERRHPVDLSIVASPRKNVSAETLIPGTAVSATRYGEMHFLPNDDPIGKSFHYYGEWAQVEIEFLLSFIASENVILDVGANVGSHTVASAHKVGRHGQVIAFEPQDVVATVLEHNLELTGWSNVTVHRAGVGEAPGRMFIPQTDYSSHVNVGAVALEALEKLSSAAVPITTIDALSLNELQLAKIDAEGMDAQVLAGMKLTITRLRPIIYVECNTVDDGLRLKSANDWMDYSIFLVRTAAFNPENHARNHNNVFGGAREFSLLFVPAEKLHLLPSGSEVVEIIPVHDVQSLALAVLATPRFGDGSRHDRDWGWLPPELKAQREAAIARASDLQRLQFREASLTQQLQIAKAEKRTLLDQLEAARARAAETEGLRKQIANKDDIIRLVYASTSWRVSAPIRTIKRVLGKLRHLASRRYLKTSN